MAFTGMSYTQFVADQKKKGVTVQGGDGSYNRYTSAQSAGTAGADYRDTASPAATASGGGSGGGYVQNASNLTAGTGNKTTQGLIAGLATGFAGLGANAVLGSMAAGTAGGGMAGGGQARNQAQINRFTENEKNRMSASGNAQMVNVGGRQYRTDQMFDVEIDGVAGSTRMDAIQAARAYSNMPSAQSSGHDYYSQNTTSPGQTSRIRPIIGQQAAPPPVAPAPAAPSGGGGGGGSSSSAPAEPNLPKVTDPITDEERDEITKPASGLEDTIKTSPRLLRERRRRSYLTAGG